MDCDNHENEEAFCLKIDFHDNGPNEMIVLDKMGDCVYYGTFENEKVDIAASSMDCPMIENSTMQVHYMNLVFFQCLDED